MDDTTTEPFLANPEDDARSLGADLSEQNIIRSFELLNLLALVLGNMIWKQIGLGPVGIVAVTLPLVLVTEARFILAG